MVAGMGEVSSILRRVASREGVYRQQMETVATAAVFKALPSTVSVGITRQPAGVTVSLSGFGALKAGEKVKFRLEDEGVKAARNVANGS